MIVVKIELWPRGDETKARSLGLARIWNDGSGDTRNGNYQVELEHSGIYRSKKGVWKKGIVKNHLRKLSPYHLVMKAFKNTL